MGEHCVRPVERLADPLHLSIERAELESRSSGISCRRARPPCEVSNPHGEQTAGVSPPSRTGLPEVFDEGLV